MEVKIHKATSTCQQTSMRTSHKTGNTET